MFKGFFHRLVPHRLSYRRALFALLSLLMFAEPVWTQEISQPDKVLRDRIDVNRQKIDTAASWHATDTQLGKLWLQLAYDYEAELDVQGAEEAYARSLKLLRTSSSQKYYADALNGLGSLYQTTSRLKESESCRRKALAIYEALEDEAGIARVHVAVAIDLLQEQSFKQSEAESSQALESLRRQAEPDKTELVAGLVASSYAKCFQGRCKEGMLDAREAMTLARAAFAKDATPVIAALLAVGFEQWKTGAQADGEKAMREALELLREKKDMPRRMLLDAQLMVLTRYTDYLKTTHQKVMAKQMEDEIEWLKRGQPPLCRDCTVNVVALSSNAR
jgi:tetratricopeptide (TPR) repeat protein